MIESLLLFVALNTPPTPPTPPTTPTTLSTTLPTATPTPATLPQPALPQPALPAAAADQGRAGTMTPGPLVLVGAGDIAQCPSPNHEKTAVLVEQVLAKSLQATAFTLGDNVYPHGSLEQYFRCYEPSWGRFKSRTLPVVGNHEYETPNAAGFRGTFAGRFSTKGPLWYSVDVSGLGSDGAPARWHVVVLDSNCDKVECGVGSAQYTWLVADLKKNAATRCTVALFHHPRFSSGPHGDASTMKDLWRALDQADVDLVLSGHDHTYERFAALNSEGVVVKGAGIASIVAGTGGKSHYPILASRQHSAFHAADDYGVLVLGLDNGGWRSHLLTVTGEEKDKNDGTCH